MTLIEVYGHGGDLQTAARTFGVSADAFVDFSANINPLGPPVQVMERLQRELTRLVHYPDPGQRRLRQALAEKLGIEIECVLVGNGAAECMAVILQACKPQTVGVAYPCFSEYSELSRKHGASVKGCMGTEPAYKCSVDELQALMREVDLLFVGTPNNPTGITYERAELTALAEAAERTGTWLVVDEAFLDFVDPCRQQTLLHDLPRYPRTILVRSMTKMYAIPGLRLGYAIAHPDMITQMKEKQVPWSVNQLALAAGEECLALEEYEQATRKLIATERTYLLDAMETELGFSVCPGEANFLLVRLPSEWTAQALQQELGLQGILIRNCAMYPGLTPHHVRFAVRTREDNDRLLAACRQIVLNKGGTA